MIFQKFAKFICDCFCKGPVPREVVTNVCNAGGSGSNPMRGSSCSEPTLVEATIVRAVDPPQCYGGDATLCSPMPLSFRVVFPCPVPGSSNCPPPVPVGNVCNEASLTCQCDLSPVTVTLPQIVASLSTIPAQDIICDAPPYGVNCAVTGNGVTTATHGIVVTVIWCDEGIKVGIHITFRDGNISLVAAQAMYQLAVDMTQCSGTPIVRQIPFSYTLGYYAVPWPSSIEIAYTPT